MEKLTSNRINFAFLDGAHTYRDVRDEYRHIEKYVKSIFIQERLSDAEYENKNLPQWRKTVY